MRSANIRNPAERVLISTAEKIQTASWFFISGDGHFDENERSVGPADNPEKNKRWVPEKRSFPAQQQGHYDAGNKRDRVLYLLQAGEERAPLVFLNDLAY